ncbi:MAG: hypothetical protein JWN32_3254 [Solirubrobacterales bacterium]|nr:hypothetical protein [Solirubrobacterales bacterium]
MSERDILTRVSLLTLVGIAAMWFLLISPKRDDASKQARRVTTAEQRLATASQTLATGQRAQVQAPENRRILVALGTALPDSAGAAALLRELNGTSNHDNVAFRTASLAGGASSAPAAGVAQLPPGAALGANGLPTLPLTLTFDGRYLRLTTLLDRLRRFVSLAGTHVVVHGRLLSVESVQLTRDDPASPTVSASLAATAYLAPLPGASPTTPGAASTTTPGATGATSSAGTTTTASAGATP